MTLRAICPIVFESFLTSGRHAINLELRREEIVDLVQEGITNNMILAHLEDEYMIKCSLATLKRT